MAGRVILAVVTGLLPLVALYVNVMYHRVDLMIAIFAIDGVILLIAGIAMTNMKANREKNIQNELLKLRQRIEVLEKKQP